MVRKSRTPRAQGTAGRDQAAGIIVVGVHVIVVESSGEESVWKFPSPDAARGFAEDCADTTGLKVHLAPKGTRWVDPS